MGDLPVDRVRPNKPPFSFLGFDCFGLCWVKKAISQVKRYGVLFTCLATRAIHLEVAQGIHTDSFVNSMRRFIARRGIPEVMRSDNSSKFVTGNGRSQGCQRMEPLHLRTRESISDGIEAPGNVGDGYPK